MAGVTVTQQIKAPVEKVFQLATDFRNAAGRIKKIKKLEVLTEGPVKVGTRFRETRLMFNRECTEEMVVTEFEPPRRYVLAAESHGSSYRTELLFTPEGGGTKLVMKFEATPLTFMARMMSFMMKLMMKQVVKMCSADLEDLKKAAEA